MDWKASTEIASNIASALAIGGAAGWFLYTSQFKPRLQFDLDCRFVQLRDRPEQMLAELHFIFLNTGYVEHRIWNLSVSVHTLCAEGALLEKEQTKEVVFTEPLLRKTQLVPKRYGFYFVRPGVRQLITHTIAVPATASAIRVTASFDYRRNDPYPHTGRRVFRLPGVPAEYPA